MKKAAKVMDVIAIICIVLYMLLMGAIFAGGLVAVIDPAKYLEEVNKVVKVINEYLVENNVSYQVRAFTAESLKQYGLYLIIWGAVLFVYLGVVLCIFLGALRNLKFNSPNKGVHIAALIFGILSVGLFGILGGAFGIAAASRVENQNNQAVEQ